MLVRDMDRHADRWMDEQTCRPMYVQADRLRESYIHPIHLFAGYNNLICQHITEVLFKQFKHTETFEYHTKH